MASDKVFNVLFLCTHNSARSIMAEVIINYVGRGNSRASRPAATRRRHRIPFALDNAAAAAFPTEGLYSKDWEEFAKPECARHGFRSDGLR